MKKYLIFAILFLILSYVLFGQELTGKKIIEKANETFNPDTVYARMKMTITTSSGKERTFVYDSWSTNSGEKNLMRYLEPRRVKDQAILMLNNANDIWVYFPRTGRVRKLATHAKKQKMEGSDFSYEDMGSGDAFIDDYTAERLDDEKMEGYDCYKLELTRKPESDLSYPKMILWIIKENFVPIVIDYYSENYPDRVEKRLVQSDVQVIDGIPTAKKIVMQNKNDNTQTRMELLDVKYNLTLDDDMFTERTLKK
ncbi:MAG: outer membrane lipoprotein-sorting protein [Candidatus Aminicenantes bacterium]|nr:outer membrane lipoprotein-sorting protein [Candidatus Aminicenantes bacterium]